MISQITTQISGHCDRSHILWYIVFLSSILSIHLSRSSPRALWELEAWEAVLLTAGMWAGKSLHLFRCGLHGLEDKWPGSLSRWPYLSFVQTLYFCKCCCLFVFNIAQWFEGEGVGVFHWTSLWTNYLCTHLYLQFLPTGCMNWWIDQGSK